jgi:hypothetical protein
MALKAEFDPALKAKRGPVAGDAATGAPRGARRGPKRIAEP